jgi:hypothetical protein
MNTIRLIAYLAHFCGKKYCRANQELTYIGIRTLTNTGSDTDTLALGCSVMW